MRYLRQVGQLTVIPKPNKRNTIPEDFGIEPEYEGIPYDLVIDGTVMKDNLKAIGRDYTWLKKEVRKIWNKPRTGIDCDTGWEGANILSKKGCEYIMKKETIIVFAILFAMIIVNIITRRYTDNVIDEIARRIT